MALFCGKNSPMAGHEAGELGGKARIAVARATLGHARGKKREKQAAFGGACGAPLDAPSVRPERSRTCQTKKSPLS